MQPPAAIRTIEPPGREIARAGFGRQQPVGADGQAGHLRHAGVRLLDRADVGGI